MEKKKKETYPENQFPRAEISFILKKKLLPSNFKNFNKTLNERILFPLNQKSVSTRWKEENLFSQPGISDKWTKLFFTRQKNNFY